MNKMPNFLENIKNGMSSELVPVGVAILIPNLGSYISRLQEKYPNPWYTGLKKPKWVAPNGVFVVVWTSLYSTMGYASYLVWKEGNGFNGPAKIPLMVYGGQLALNFAWSPIFFGSQNIKLAFIDNLALDVAAATTAYMFYKIDSKAGYLFVPYLIWLAYESTLMFRLWRDNPEKLE